MNTSSNFANVFAYSGLPSPGNLVSEFIYRNYEADETTTASTTGSRLVRLNFDVSKITQAFVVETDEGGFSLRTGTIKGISPLNAQINDINLDDVHSIEDITNMPCTFLVSQDTGIVGRVSDAIQRSCRMRGITGNSTDKAYRLSQQISGSSINADIIQAFAVNRDREGILSFRDGIVTDAERFLQVTGIASEGVIYDKFVFDILSSAEINLPSRSPVNLGLISRYLQERQNNERLVPPAISLGNFTSFLNPISYENSDITDDFGFEIVGHIIERVEEFSSGERNKEVIGRLGYDSSNTTFIDGNVKYGARYSYTIKSLYEATVPQIITGRSEAITSKVLVFSAPSSIASITAENDIPPPPPTDVSFSFDHTRGELVIRWEFPVNPQQDVTRFQLFRRRSIAESFILLKEFDFDRSSSPVIRSDAPLPINVIKSNFPVRRFIDHDFGRSSDYIYALCSVDAHGLVSNYSTQFRVTFNRRLNTIIVKSISSSGAPRSYPNLYLNNPDSLTLDSISERGPTRMRIVFDPEYHDVTASGFNLELLKFIENDAKYFVNVIDTDRAEQVSVPISIISGSI